MNYRVATFRTASSGNSELASTTQTGGEDLVALPVTEHTKWHEGKGNSTASCNRLGDNQEVGPLQAEVQMLKEKLKQSELDREFVLSQLSQTVQNLQVPKCDTVQT